MTTPHPGWQDELVDKYLDNSIVANEQGTLPSTSKTDFLAAIQAAYERGKADQFTDRQHLPLPPELSQ